MFRQVIQDIKRTLVHFLSKKILMSIQNPIVDDRTSEVTYSRNPSRLGEVSKYDEFFMSLYEGTKFLCLLNDASIIQAYYKFKSRRGRLLRAVLEYIPNPEFRIDPEFRENANAESSLIESREKKNLSPYTSRYVRIDYNPEAREYREILHPRAHIHIGLESNYRIAIDRIPYFSEFVTLILFLNYRDDWIKLNPKMARTATADLDISTYLPKRMRNKSEKYIKFSLTKCEEAHYLFLP